MCETVTLWYTCVTLGTRCGSQRKDESESINTLHVSSFVVLIGKHLDSVCIKRGRSRKLQSTISNVEEKVFDKFFFTQKVFPVYGIGQFLTEAKFWLSVTKFNHFSWRFLLPIFGSHKPTIILNLSARLMDFIHWWLNNPQHERWLQSNRAWRSCSRHLVEQWNRTQTTRLKLELQTKCNLQLHGSRRKWKWGGVEYFSNSIMQLYCYGILSLCGRCSLSIVQYGIVKYRCRIVF